jgi:hypothetical protein
MFYNYCFDAYTLISSFFFDQILLKTINIEQYSETEVQIIINNINIFMALYVEFRDINTLGLVFMCALNKLCDTYLKNPIGLKIIYASLNQIRCFYYKFKEDLKEYEF